MNDQEHSVECRRRVMLAIQVALLGMVTPNLRGVTAAWSSPTIRVRLLYDGPVGEEENECASDVEAELLAAFTDCSVHVFAERVDFPNSLEIMGLQAWAFRRKEQR